MRGLQKKKRERERLIYGALQSPNSLSNVQRQNKSLKKSTKFGPQTNAYEQ